MNAKLSTLIILILGVFFAKISFDTSNDNAVASQTSVDRNYISIERSVAQE